VDIEGDMYNETQVFADTAKSNGSVIDTMEYSDPGLTDTVVLCKTPSTLIALVEVGEVPELDTSLKEKVASEPLIHNTTVFIIYE
jgi:hypothetical protein